MSEAVQLEADEPMRLDRAVQTLRGQPGFPKDLTLSMLRTEIRKGRLAYSEVAGKFYVTPAQIKELFRPCPAAPKAPASTSEQDDQGGRPSGSSVTDRLRSAQAAALATSRRPNAPSETTSPASSRRRSSKPTADVIQLRS